MYQQCTSACKHALTVIHQAKNFFLSWLSDRKVNNPITHLKKEKLEGFQVFSFLLKLDGKIGL